MQAVTLHCPLRALSHMTFIICAPAVNGNCQEAHVCIGQQAWHHDIGTRACSMQPDDHWQMSHCYRLRLA